MILFNIDDKEWPEITKSHPHAHAEGHLKKIIFIC